MKAIDDFAPQVGQAESLAPMIRRILAPNASPMTYLGTNTYLVGTHGIAVIDPGPDDDRHLAAILGAIKPGQQITHILVTHAHLDHSPLAARLSSATGAPVYAYGSARAGRSAVMTQLAAHGLIEGGEGVDAGFAPDIPLRDGAVITGDVWQMTAHWTPGHFGNHMCFALGDTVFVGDLVMGWASSLVSPPDGDLTDFMASCRKIRGLNAHGFHSGHGAPITDPAARLDWLINHRLARETAILAALDQRPATAEQLTTLVYTDTPAALLPAAQRNVLAHLIDLHGKNQVSVTGDLTADTVFSLGSVIK